LARENLLKIEGFFLQWQLDLKELSSMHSAGSGDRRMAAGVPDFFVKLS
jgi:hypothetical protein